MLVREKVVLDWLYRLIRPSLLFSTLWALLLLLFVPLRRCAVVCFVLCAISSARSSLSSGAAPLFYSADRVVAL